MKHLSGIYAQVAIQGATALENHTPDCPPPEKIIEPDDSEVGTTMAIAQEGLVDALKQGWQSFKEKVRPTDYSAIMKKIAFLPEMKKSVAALKTTLSKTKDADFGTKAIGHVSKFLPVSANTAEELVREVAAMRKRIAVLIHKLANTKDEKEVKKYRQELAMEFSKRGNVSDQIVFSRQTALKFCDEMTLFIGVIEDIGHEYEKAHARIAAEGGKVATEGFDRVIALESHTETLEIALESAGGIIVGTVILLGAVFVRIIAYLALLSFIGSVITANIPIAIVSGAGMYLAFWISQAGLDKSMDLIFGEESE